jgi:two-component system, cell cycle sensor histidine kinase and response regulator CckA
MPAFRTARSAPLRRTTAATALVVLAAAAVSLAGTSSVITLARDAERVRNSIDAVTVIKRDVALAQAEHRSYVLDPTADRLAQYRSAQQLRNAHLDSLQKSAAVDDSLGIRLASVRTTLSQLDAFRDTLIRELSTSSNERVRSVLSSSIAVQARNNVDATLTALERVFRARLAVAQPALDRRRALVLVVIPAMLLTALGLLAWLYQRLIRVSQVEAAQAAHYREMIDESPDGVMVHRHNLIIYANVQAGELAGAPSAAALLGRNAMELVLPEDRAAVEERASALIERRHRPAPRLTRMNRLDGTVIEVETRIAQVDFNGEPAIEVTMRDVVERRQREVALAASEQRFRAVLQSMEEGVVLQDEQLNIVLWNAAAERILGLTADQLAGKTSYDPDWRATDESGDDLPGERHFAPIAIRTARPAAGVMGVRRPDGSRSWLNVSAIPLLAAGESTAYAVVATFTDITTQRETVRRLAESESKFRLITEHTADLITLRSADDTLLFVSPSHERQLGWTPDELMGRRGATLVHPDDLPLLAGSADALFSGVGPQQATLRVRHKDGHWVWLEVVAAPIAAGSGPRSTFVTAARDITERRRLEEELRQAQKMESLGRVASAVAHDFNNMLTAIRGSAELLLLDEQDGLPVADGVSEITEAVERAAGLTAQLLAFARRQHTDAVAVHCAAVIQSAESVLARLTAPRVRVVTEVTREAQRAMIWADRSQFEQVLFNLVLNARDASTPHSVVTVRLSCERLAAERSGRYGAIAAGAYVTLTVVDHGAGMSEETLTQLFEPFFTTKPQGKGTGLGLSTVYGIVMQHGGGITLESAEQVGSTFTVYWPRHDEDAVMSETVDAPPARTPPLPARRATTMAPGPAVSHRETLLLVDDEPAVRRTVAKLLERGGFRVVQAGSGREAITLLDNQRMPIDALVTDVRMPGMSGVELVKSLADRGIDLPVLFISGQIDDPIPVSWPSDKPRRFLRKPFQGDELTVEVRELFAGVR